ncbi:hypothetical protein [Flavobacterium sp. H122]|uniref:hypothetical protein n=1 Tax=Flavobacterium sp. H122 TaxID=2529860 RepID=UPI0010AAA8A9|nr:hypothetical protein [Flavobacterium sp. H122]
MNLKLVFCFIALAILGFSCKENQASKNTVTEKNTTEKTLNKTYQIPSGYKIENQEEVDFDNDGMKETIITASDESAIKTTEFWIKDNQLLYEFTYPWEGIKKRWLVNLDDDALTEIVRIEGDEDGTDYVIYDIVNKQQKPILFFNPVLEDSRYPGQYMWAYPNDIEGLVVNQKKEIQVSLNNDFVRDDNHTEPENQKELPFVFFKRKTSQPNMKLSKMNKPQFIRLEGLVAKVFKNKEDQDAYKKWTGKYSCNFLRIKEESVDPRAWGMIYLVFQDNKVNFKLESYVENIFKDLQLESIDKDKIVLSIKEDKSKLFTITDNGKNFILKSSFIDDTIGELQTYKLEKNKMYR